MFKLIGAALWFAWDFLIPRFRTEDVALRYVGGDRGEWSSYDVVCSMSDIEPGEQFDGIASIDAFQAFFVGYGYRFSNWREFVNPHDVTEASHA